MPLVACPSCKARTPTSSIRCVHCGGLPPACADCGGVGTCPVCTDPSAPLVTDSLGAGVCDRCGGNAVCPGCGGGKRRWPAAG